MQQVAMLIERILMYWWVKCYHKNEPVKLPVVSKAQKLKLLGNGPNNLYQAI